MIMVNFLTPITCIGVGSWLKIEPSQSKTSDSYDTPFTRASPQVWYYAQRIGSSICIKDGVILAISIAIFSSIPMDEYRVCIFSVLLPASLIWNN